MSSFKELAQKKTQILGKLNKDIPEVLQHFHGLGQAATKPGALETKTKELIALSIAVTTHCTACIAFHMKKCVKLGATREEVTETLSMAVYMGGGPALMYAAEALEAFEEFSA